MLKRWWGRLEKRRMATESGGDETGDETGGPRDETGDKTAATAGDERDGGDWCRPVTGPVSTGCPTVVGQPVDSVEKFTYLGFDMDSSGRSAPDMLRRIGLTQRQWADSLRFSRKKRLSLSTKLRIYDSCVLSVLLYGLKAWTLLREDGRRLQAFQNLVSSSNMKK